MSILSLSQRLSRLIALILEAEKEFGRPPHSVRLLIVSKTQGLEKLIPLIRANQRIFGENYVNEARIKIKALANNPIEWHFIGKIQRNKIKLITENFTWVQTLCSLESAIALNHYAAKLFSPLNVCLQLNIFKEKNKSGIDLKDIYPLADKMGSFPYLAWRGLMALPPIKENFDDQRRCYKKLLALFENLKLNYPHLDTLSIGTSHDFRAAIAEGSTLIRIGRHLFDEHL